MGTPAYPVDLATELRAIRAALRDLSSASLLVNPTGRPWTPAVVTDVSNWPSTTSTSFTSLQNVSSFRSHDRMYMTVSMSVPAAGSQFRITLSDGSTVVYGPISLSSGNQTASVQFNMPGSISVYSEFTLLFQAKSVTAGQTTSGIVLNAYSRS